MYLTEEKFLDVIKATPLVSIDLIVRNSAGDVLLGRRVNRPARDFWFVPGGRIRKNEPISDAICRIADSELSLSIALENLRFTGVFEHYYRDNVYNHPGINTHYVVLLYEYQLQESIPFKKDNQHSRLKWWKVSNLLDCPEVHENTKAYFCRTPLLSR